MPATPLAVEAKLNVDTLFAVPDLRGLPGVDAVVELPTARLEATYFDTPDLALLAARITLRHRIEPDAPPGSPGTWTLTLPKSAGGRALARSELTWEGPADAIPAEVISLTRARVRRSALRPVATLETRRQRFALMGADGLPAAELDDDLVKVNPASGGGESFRQIEVEITESSTAKTLQAAVERLQAAGAEPGHDGSTLRRALGRPPITKRLPLRPRTRSTVGELVRACLADGLSTIIAHDVGIRLGGDVEHVHEARTSARRLRSELRMFRPLLDPEWEQRLSQGLKRLGRALGAVRDADVMVAGLQEAVAKLEPADAAAAGTLLSRLVHQREAAALGLRAELDSEEYVDLLDALAAGTVAPELVRAENAEARAALPGLMAPTWKRTRSQVKRLDDVPADEDLHELRKRAKHVRYAAERAAPVLGKPAGRLARRAKKLQDVLGELHDNGVVEQWLRSQKRLKPAAGVAVGELIAAAVERQQDARERWPRQWAKAQTAWKSFKKAASG